MTTYSAFHHIHFTGKAVIGMEITRIEKVNYVAEAYKQLREMIVSNHWPEGTKLASENELATDFHVSRVVVREALQMLRAEKLIVTRQGVGTFVANPSNFIHPDTSIHLTIEVYQRFIEFRNAVEISAIKIAATKATEDDFKHIQDCLNEMDRCMDDVEHYSEADYAYHLSIIRAAHNELLERAMLANQKAITSVLCAMNSIPKSQSFGVKTHGLILQDLRNKDIKQIVDRYNKMAAYNLARLTDFFSSVEE